MSWVSAPLRSPKTLAAFLLGLVLWSGFSPWGFARERVVITRQELKEFNSFQPRSLPPQRLKDTYVRVKLFALAAEREGLLKTSPSTMKGLIKAARLYGVHICQSWEPSEEAILSYYLAHQERFTSCNGTIPFEEARPQIIKILQQAACKKLIYQRERELRRQAEIVFEE